MMRNNIFITYFQLYLFKYSTTVDVYLTFTIILTLKATYIHMSKTMQTLWGFKIIEIIEDVRVCKNI